MSQADGLQAEKRVADEATFERERASGNKLWTVYISESQIYEKDLIHGWRSEMEGLLTFAGLFSGVLTIFIIESYKTLNPNPTDQTLNPILHPSANLNNGAAAADALPGAAAAFSPPISSLICNALWFISLTLSLSCALVATLVKQWAQEFPHRVVMLSSRSVLSRASMYLNYGFRRFNMHVVVRAPLLFLHVALVLFFAGLVAFLVPVNTIIMGTCSAVLLLFVFVYGTFTVLPLFYPNIPFHTPLTQILLPLKQQLGTGLAAFICMAYARKRVAEADLEAHVFPETRSGNAVLQRSKRAALHPDVEEETEALAWTVQSLSDDHKLLPFVQGLPEALWDFDENRPRSVYQAHFQSLLQDADVHLGQRLADFMAGSNSNLLDNKERSRRQLSVLEAVWAICAFSLHTGSPLHSPIGDADVDNALLGSKFLDSPAVQSMVPDVSALIRLNMIEATLIQPSSRMRPQAEKQRQSMQRTYVDYLLALSKCRASFQREQTSSLFHRSQAHLTRSDGFENLQDALQLLIDSAPDETADETADNFVFAARQIISAFAQTSDYPARWRDLEGLGPPYLSLWHLGPFLLRFPSLAVSGSKSDSQPGPEHHYTRFPSHTLCQNLELGFDPQASVDALRLIYEYLLATRSPPRDLETHFRVLGTLQTRAAGIRTHRLTAVVQSVVLRCFREDLSKSADLSQWGKLPDLFNDEGWFRSVIGYDDDQQTERASAQEVYECACVHVVTTFLEHSTARSPDQTERGQDLATLKSVRHAVDEISSALPTKLQHRFVEAASGFIHKYPKDCLAEEDGLFRVLLWAVIEGGGFITNLDALMVLDTSVSDVQTDDQQESHRGHAKSIRRQTQKRLHPENIPAGPVPLVSGGV